MSTSLNPFDLLGEDDSDDISKLVAVAIAKQKASAAAETDKKEELPSKNQPGKFAKNESQGGGRGGGGCGQDRRGGHGKGGRASDRGFTGKVAKNESQGGGRGGGGRGQVHRGGHGKGGRGFDRGFIDNVNSNSSNTGYSGGFDGAVGQDGGGYGGGYGSNHGSRRADFSNGDVNYDHERPARRTFERHSGNRSGTGRGSDVKRDGSGRGNWGTTEDDIVVEPKEPINELDKTVVEKQDAHATQSFENKELSDEKNIG